MGSIPARGTIFTVKLSGVLYEPRKSDFSVPETAGLLELPSIRRRVLLVDDVPMNLKVLQAMLRRMKIESVCVDFAAMTLEILDKDQDFNFILTDLWMSEMDGEQLTDAISGLHMGPHPNDKDSVIYVLFLLFTLDIWYRFSYAKLLFFYHRLVYFYT